MLVLAVCDSGKRDALLMSDEDCEGVRPDEGVAANVNVPAGVGRVLSVAEFEGIRPWLLDAVDVTLCDLDCACVAVAVAVLTCDGVRPVALVVAVAVLVASIVAVLVAVPRVVWLLVELPESRKSDVLFVRDTDGECVRQGDAVGARDMLLVIHPAVSVAEVDCTKISDTVNVLVGDFAVLVSVFRCDCVRPVSLAVVVAVLPIENVVDGLTASEVVLLVLNRRLTDCDSDKGFVEALAIVKRYTFEVA